MGLTVFKKSLSLCLASILIGQSVFASEFDNTGSQNSVEAIIVSEDNSTGELKTFALHGVNAGLLNENDGELVESLLASEHSTEIKNFISIDKNGPVSELDSDVSTESWGWHGNWNHNGRRYRNDYGRNCYPRYRDNYRYSNWRYGNRRYPYRHHYRRPHFSFSIWF